MNKDFAFIDALRLSAFLIKRDGEERIGERMTFGTNSIESALESFAGKYVILGVEEDIGPRANGGLPGAMGAFKAFLSRFLNMQANSFLDTENIMIIGRAKFECVETGFDKLRETVQEIDEFLIELLIPIYKAGKVPILVGGGHNNAYPLMKAYFLALNKKLNVINLDPHADFRPLEGRHSGNSFSYAMHDGMLNSYSVFGLHKPYNSAEMLGRLNSNKNVWYSCYEDYIDGSRCLTDDAKTFSEKYKNEFGLELDLDSIANMPTSAMSPSGWTVSEVRQWLRIMKRGNPVYFHFTEGAPDLDIQGGNKIGKTLAYFVCDVIEK